MTNDATGDAGWYAFDKLEVYQLAVEVRRIVKRILRALPPDNQDDYDQLKRSTKSSIRNICEGAAEFRPLEKARFYRMSLRSAQETGGSLRILEEDLGANPLFDEAHSKNFILVAKLTVLASKKGR